MSDTTFPKLRLTHGHLFMGDNVFICTNVFVYCMEVDVYGSIYP